MFQHQQPLVGAEDLVFQLLEFGGDVPFAGGQGLFAGEAVRHAAHIAAADLDVIAEHLVEADLQLGDAGLLPQFGFQLGEHPLAPVHDVPQLVHLGVVAGADGAAVLEVGRRVVHQGAGDLVQDVGQGVHGVGQPGEQRRVRRRGLGPDGGQLAAGIPEGLDLPRDRKSVV